MKHIQDYEENIITLDTLQDYLWGLSRQTVEIITETTFYII